MQVCLRFRANESFRSSWGAPPKFSGSLAHSAEGLRIVGIRSPGRRSDVLQSVRPVSTRVDERARLYPHPNPESHYARLCCHVRLSNGMSAFSNRRRVQGSIPLQPCIPRRAHSPPNGDGWVHEIKHDGFRILARREGDRIRLFTRNGYDFAVRFPKIALAVAASPVRSCVVDGERSSSIGRGRPAKGALALAFDERIQKDLANVL
jgi:hypothetical protein